MHKDYRVTSPVQIIKYANRTEFRNVGYSLKPQEQLGLPGSMPRNEILAQVFQDIHYAEAKGTGISTMREEMRKANLSVPLIESDRSTNLFILTLLPHHLFNSQDIQWLQSFKDHHLSDEEARTLIIIREKGAISNSEYRTINGVDTLTASTHLRRLRDLELLEQRGRGNATFYVPTAKLLAPDINQSNSQVSPLPGELTPHISPLSGELTPHVSPLSGELSTLFNGFSDLSEEVKSKIKNLKKRTLPQEIKDLIKELCGFKPMKLSEIAIILDRNPKYIYENYLNNMVKSQELAHIFDDPNHPHQAYITKKANHHQI